MAKARILIVEDEYVIAENLQTKLEKEGYIVCASVPSGKKAIQKAETEKPDVVLMDIMLKGDMDGIEAASQIRARFGIPIIYLTAFSDKSILERAKITEPFGYLIKPFQDRELYANIEMTIYKARIEEELMKARKLESVGILAGGIAHDFNNLLSVILGNINMAREEAISEYGISVFLAEAEKASLRAKDLTHQLITLSKGGAPVKKRGSVKKLIKESILMALAGSNVSCEFYIPDDLWPAEFDESQIRQVFNNLVMNASQAMPAGGNIRVCAKNFRASKEAVLYLTDGNYVKISIEDRGIGISAEHLPMIFDAYFSTKERGVQKGMGLGLAIAYSIIRKHKGHITAESELGIGSIFHIYLPAFEKETGDKKEAVEIKSETDPGKRNILVMDDEEMVRDLLKHILDRMGHESDFAQNGAEAVHLYKKAKESGEPFDAVILDLTVQGGMGGRDTIRELKEIAPDVKAIISSGYSNDPIMANFEEYGFSGALPKPSTMKELKNILLEVLA